MEKLSRRSFIKSSLTAGAAAAYLPRCSVSAFKWKLTVITSEISQDLDHALSVMQEFGLRHAELRFAWGVNVADWDENFTMKVKESLDRKNFVTVNLASPIFKCELPPAGEDQAMWERERRYLNNLIRISGILDCKLIRIFGFSPVTDLNRDYNRIVDYLGQATDIASEAGRTLVFENVSETNFCTTEATLPLFKDIQSPYFGWLYDPANCRRCGGMTFPDAYEKIPKDRIKYVHIKDVSVNTDGSMGWAPVGEGVLDVAGICSSLKRDGYQGFISLETHYKPENGTKEDGTRASWSGLQKVLNRI